MKAFLPHKIQKDWNLTQRWSWKIIWIQWRYKSSQVFKDTQSYSREQAVMLYTLIGSWLKLDMPIDRLSPLKISKKLLKEINFIKTIIAFCIVTTNLAQISSIILTLWAILQAKDITISSNLKISISIKRIYLLQSQACEAEFIKIRLCINRAPRDNLMPMLLDNNRLSTTSWWDQVASLNYLRCIVNTLRLMEEEKETLLSCIQMKRELKTPQKRDLPMMISMLIKQLSSKITWVNIQLSKVITSQEMEPTSFV